MTYNVTVDYSGQELQQFDKCGFRTLKEAKDYCEEIAEHQLKWEDEDYNCWVASYKKLDLTIYKS